MNKRMSYFGKIIFYLAKPPVILILGKGEDFMAKIISSASGNRNIKIYPIDLINNKINEVKFLTKNSSLPVLIISENKEKNYSSESDLEKIGRIVKNFPKTGFIAIDNDFPQWRKIKSESSCYILTYGLNPEANLSATDINVREKGTNMKINYEGKSIPFWLETRLTEKEIKIFLAAICGLVVNKINLVEISQILKDYNFNN